LKAPLVCENITFTYGNGFKLGPLSLTFKEAAFNVILGPNGSGKTTLFSLIRGRNKVTSGSVLYKNIELTNMSDKNRARVLGVVPQLSERGFDYSVSEMILMGFYARKGKPDKKELLRILEEMDLGHLAEKSVREISGGEYQRVLLARVMMQDPEILLLDEPANHLDLRHQFHLLNKLKEETVRGRTVIAVLHDINHTLQYAEHAVIMNEGQCYKTGKPHEILTPALIKDIFRTDLTFYENKNKSKKILGPL